MVFFSVIKEITEKLKQNAEQYGVHEDSPVGVQWVGEDLLWKGFVEQVLSLEWKREEVMDGVMSHWRWQMMTEVDGVRQEDYSKDREMHTGMSDLWFWEKMMVMISFDICVTVGTSTTLQQTTSVAATDGASVYTLNTTAIDCHMQLRNCILLTSLLQRFPSINGNIPLKFHGC